MSGDNGNGQLGGRAEGGRFAPGNKLGRGNPLAGRAAKIRAILLRKLTPGRANRVADELIKKAEGGDLAYIRELLDRTIGKPAQTDLAERVEALEALLPGRTERRHGYEPDESN